MSTRKRSWRVFAHPEPADRNAFAEVRTFGTFEHQLIKLREWLIERGVTSVAMEATGVYWKPVVRHEALFDREEMKGLLLRAVAAAC